MHVLAGHAVGSSADAKAAKQWLACARVLLQEGADTTLQNEENFTPHDIAHLNANQELAELLAQHKPVIVLYYLRHAQDDAWNIIM